MGQSADQIRQEIDQKRADASSKIDQLQQQVQGTTEQVRDQVQESVEQVVEQVKGTVDDTIQTVKNSVDFRQQIEERPLVALGVAILGGFLLGGMSGGGSNGGSSGHAPQQGYGSSNEYRSTSSHGSGSSTVRTALQKSGLEDTISNAAAALMGSVTDQLKSTLDRNFPGFADKMQTAQNKPGSLADKTHETQKTS